MTGGGDPVMALAGKHACVSFAHPGQMEVAAELCQSVILDNGAFSAWKGDKQFDFDGFVGWVERWYRHPTVDWYVMPDVIDGTEDDNLKMRVRWGKSVSKEIYARGVPVWHLNESLGVLSELVNAYDRICIGSSGQFSSIGTPVWWQRIAEAMAVICDAEGFPKVKLHGLRMLDPTIFSHLPFSSADSTNVARNIGIDKRWSGPYSPKSRRTRALIMMERIESHASAARWCGSGGGAGKNEELFG